jgi:hypothetical protein
MRDGSGSRKSKKRGGAAQGRFVPGGRIDGYKCLPHFYRGISPAGTNVSKSSTCTLVRFVVVDHMHVSATHMVFFLPVKTQRPAREIERCHVHR